MKTAGLVIFVLTASFAIFCGLVGIVMVILGALGNIFDIEAFKLLSFWNVALIAIIFGLMGWGAGSN